MTPAERLEHLRWILRGVAENCGHDVTIGQLCAEARTSGVQDPEEDLRAVAAQVVADLVAKKRAETPPPTREERGAVRCPARDLGVQCVRDEDHRGYGGNHVGEDGHEWFFAAYCRIGAPAGVWSICDRIENHEGRCRPRFSATTTAANAPPPAPRPKAPRGVCRCGEPRREHEREGIGGCERTGCTKYRQAFQRVA